MQGGPDLDDDELLDEQSPPSAGQPSQSPPSPSQSPPAPAGPPEPPSTPSSPGSTDDDDVGVDIDLGEIGEAVAMLAGMGINKLTKRPEGDDLWLMTSAESKGIGQALSNIANRQLPKELKDGDPADVVQIGAILTGYAMRNAMGMTKSDSRVVAAEAGAAGQGDGTDGLLGG